MAIAADGAIVPGYRVFTESPAGRNVMLIAGAAVVIAIMVAVWLWSQAPDYKVLFSNFSDRDGGAIVSSLQTMNVPYKFSDGGNAILVPAGQVYDTRLKLAAQGLPKGGSVGFELMENQKLGVSQFLEQVNFQRALEGELARSIQAVGSVQSARVHLALPKASVFVRDQQKPTASVLLHLNQGRTLDPQQVSAIVHLVASSVPDLPAKNVTVVDQNGNLLSEAGKTVNANGLDPAQLKYVLELQQNIVKRVESIITPIVGAGNVRAEATADVDFSHSEQAAEVYKPNGTPTAASIRSQQSSESTNGGSAASGIPGALTNQPQAPATAPIAGAPAAAAGAPAAASGTAQKDMTVNYEVDKTIRYVQQPMGGVKRLSVAVVVNYKRDIDKAGKVTYKPLSDAEKTQVNDLVKEAMGFNKDRGDSLNVVNSQFAGAEKEAIVEVPIWKRVETLELAKEIGKYLLAAVVLLYLFFAFLKPMLKKLVAGPPVVEAPVEALEDDTVVELSGVEPMGVAPRTYQDNLEAAKLLARSDPKVVANVVKAWVDGNE
ncbi:MAG: flagellar M-ring protein FliF [Herminiimonas sp.]|nr:flagellar M-ring protein FliF [Herminiimonas sp.]